ncbi:monocarboxylate transporter 12-like [Diadema antillarum]|uniref:monocarboxylate transporter 12-like n=1 Tax=Diadema antillarum TaxID=105358 RepID=UPI003A84D264
MAERQKVSNDTSVSEDVTQPDERSALKRNQSPVDGRWAVVVVIAVFIARTVLTTQVVAISVFIGEWAGQLGIPAAQLAWSYSIVTCLRYCAGPIAGAVYRTLGCRPLLFIGGVLAFVSLICLSFATKLWHIISCSVVSGISYGLVDQGCVIAVGIYFDRWHGCANGVAFGGASVGVMVGPLLTTVLINVFAWRGAVLILAGMVAHFCVAAMVIRPLSLWMDENCQKTSDTKVARRCSVATVSRVVSIQEDKRFAPQPQVQKHDDMQQSACTQDQTTSKPYTPVATFCRFIKALFDLTGLNLLFKSPIVVLLCVTVFFFGCGYFPTYTYVTSYAIASGIGELQATYIFTISGVCTLVVRLSHGFLLDYDVVSPPMLFGITATLAFAGNFIIALFTPFAAFAIFGVIFGFGAGTALALVPPVTKSVTSREELPTVFALQAFFQGIGQVICVYVQGVLYESTGSYSACFYLTGACLFAAGICGFTLQALTNVFQRRKPKPTRKFPSSANHDDFL